MGKTAIPDAADFALAKGTRCEIAGLVSAPHHNGQRCTLVSISGGRWKVRLEDGKTLRLRPGNVYALPSAIANGKRCTISGLVSMPHLNGRRCTLISRGEDGRWTVGLESGIYVTLKPEHLATAPRTRAPLAPILKQGVNGGLPYLLASSEGVAKKRKAAALEENKENARGGGGGNGEVGDGGESGVGMKVTFAKSWEEGPRDPTNSLSETLDGLRYPPTTPSTPPSSASLGFTEDSQVDILESRYISANFGAQKSPGSPHRRAPISWV